MKTLVFVLASLLAIGITGPVVAQTAAPSPGAPPAESPAPSSPRPDVNVKAQPESAPPGAAERRPDVNVNIERRGGAGKETARDGDSAAALPRAAAGDRTTIFGLSPTTAALLGAALLVVVILAIVAMSRTGEATYVDRERRM